MPVAIAAGLVLAVALWGGPVTAAEPGKASAEAEARAIESQLIDLQVQAGVLKSLQANAQPVDTGVVAEREILAVAPGRQDAGEIARIDAEIRRLAERYRKLTGRGTGILPQGALSRPVKAGTMVARAAEPVGSATAESTVGQGGWAGTTTVQPRQGGDPAWGQNGAAGGGWGGADSGASWQADTRTGVAGGVAGAPVGGGYGAGQGGVGGGFGQPAPQASTGGWGDTSGGRVGEVLPPGVPYPGTENGAHSDALASLDQARRQPAPQVAPQAVAPGGVASGSDLHGAEAAYEQAYGLLLQQDYGAAQFSFQEFLKQHPGSPLAGNAQYWLGEIHYVQGQYKEAARAFLTGYEQYGDGNKAADSLLKLALSLDKLNQAQAACSSLSEFFKRYGGTGEAPVEQANEVRQRLRCRS